MTIGLTDKQQAIFDFILGYVKENGFPPTMRALAERFGFASPNAALSHLKALELKGKITMVKGISRGIKVQGVRWEPVAK